MAALLLAGAVVPHAAASAASTAAITSARDVYPGSRTLTVTVTNTEGGTLLTGTAVNAFRITLPTAAAGLRNGSQGSPSCGGFTARAGVADGVHFVHVRDGRLAPGASVTCSLPVDVAAPERTDRPGEVLVHVSADDFSTTRRAQPPTAGALTTTVRVLEVINGTVAPTAPTRTQDGGTRGVTDRSGTAGQTVTYGMRVRNYSRSTLRVTPSLSTGSPMDQPVAVAPVEVPAGDEPVDMSVPLRLGSATSGSQRTTTVDAAVSTEAASARAADAFTVQGPVSFAGSNLRREGPNGSTSPSKGTCVGCRLVLRLDLGKVGLQGAAVEAVTLSFGGNMAGADAVRPFAAGGTAAQALRFVFDPVVGPAGDHPLRLHVVGEDDNLSSIDVQIDLGTLRVSDRGFFEVTGQPDIGTDADGDSRLAATNGQSVGIRGTVRSREAEVDLSSLAVYLVAAGTRRSVPLATTRGSSGETQFSGSVAIGASGTPSAWPDTADSFSVVVEVADELGHRTTAELEGRPIDTTAPILQAPALILSPRVIELSWQDGGGIRGGCDPETYLVDGIPGRVASVIDGSGQVLADGSCDPRRVTYDGVRRLVLAGGYQVSPGSTPTVTYEPLPRQLGFRLLKDVAGNEARRQTVTTHGAVDPAPPNVVSVQRRDTAGGPAYEPAYRDEAEGAWFTNVAAAPSDNRVTVAGVRDGYRVQVRDRNGGVLMTAGPYTVPRDPFGNPMTTTATVDVPLDGPPDATSADGSTRADRFVTFIDAQGRTGPAAQVSFVVDRSAPTFAATWDATRRTARVAFDEPVVAGSDAASQWSALLEEGSERTRVPAERVTAVDVRTRDVLVDTGRATFVRLDYVPAADRAAYEDRAGNLVRGTLVG